MTFQEKIEQFLGVFAETVTSKASFIATTSIPGRMDRTIRINGNAYQVIPSDGDTITSIIDDLEAELESAEGLTITNLVHGLRIRENSPGTIESISVDGLELITETPISGPCVVAQWDMNIPLLEESIEQALRIEYAVTRHAQDSLVSRFQTEDNLVARKSFSFDCNVWFIGHNSAEIAENFTMWVEGSDAIESLTELDIAFNVDSGAKPANVVVGSKRIRAFYVECDGTYTLENLSSLPDGALGVEIVGAIFNTPEQITIGL